MTAGVGEDGGLHVAPIVPETAAESLADPADVATSDRDAPDAVALRSEPADTVDSDGAKAAHTSVTQALPVLRREGVPETPGVRAVARRVASALPALGRDEITDAPLSARTTAHRRRRAVAEARTDAAEEGGSTVTPSAPAADPVGPGPVAKMPEAVAAVPEAAGVELVVEPMSETVRAVELVLEPLPPAESEAVRSSAAEGEARRGTAESEAVRSSAAEGEARRGTAESEAARSSAADAIPPSRSHATPVSRGGQVMAAQVMGQPSIMAEGDVLDAEILDDPRPSLVSVNAAAAEVLSTLTEVAFREARTDEWIMGRPEPVREPSSALELVRPGPRLLDSDSWDSGLLPAVQQDQYHGRRRATTVGGRLWVVISLVVAALVAAIAIPFALMSNEPAPTAARTPDGQVPVVEDTGSISGTSSPGSPTPTSAPALPVVGASPLVTASPTPTPSPAPPAPLRVIEAEAGATTAWGGTAGPPVSFAGATVIDELGEHWPGSTADGWLEFRNITGLAAGPYVLKIYYVYTNQAPEAPRPINAERMMNVIVNGTNVLPNQQFSPVSTITVRNVNVTLRATSNTIRLTHPDIESPAIDRIEIFQG